MKTAIIFLILQMILIMNILVSVEPNRYQQLISNSVIEALSKDLNDGPLSEVKAQAAVDSSLKENRNKVHNSFSPSFEKKMMAGIQLLENNKLTAIDKCRAIISDIDMVASFWNLDSTESVEKVQGKTIASEINASNESHQNKIRRIIAVLKTTPDTEASKLSRSIIDKVLTEEWFVAKKKSVLDEIRGGLERRPDESILVALDKTISREMIVSPIALDFMKEFGVEEMKKLSTIDANALELRAISVALKSGEEIERQFMFVLSVQFKKVMMEKQKGK